MYDNVSITIKLGSKHSCQRIARDNTIPVNEFLSGHTMHNLSAFRYQLKATIESMGKNQAHFKTSAL